MKLLPLLFLLAFLAPLRAGAQGGRAVSCGCWCGKTLPPPCSDSACIEACGDGGATYATTGTSEPPMAGVQAGTWTRHFGRKYSENLENCGPKPLCMLMSTAVAAITLPIGLAVDLPVVVVKGLGAGFYYAGKGIAYPFRRRPEPYRPVVEIAAPAPSAGPAADCSGLSAEHDSLSAQLKADAEVFDAAIVKSQLDQGVDAAKEAARDAASAGEKLGQAIDAKAMADWLKGLNAGIAGCAQAKSGTDAFHKCIDAVYTAYDQALGRIAEASRVEAARGALKEYVAAAIKKAEPFIEKSAACSAAKL